MLAFIKLLIAAVFLVVGVAFATLNNSMVTVDLYFVTHEVWLSVLLLIAVGIGIFSGGVVSAIYFMRIKKQNADLRRETRLVQQEVKNLRSMPISGH